MPSDRRIVIVGGRSAIAVRLREGPFPEAECFVRRPAATGELRVDSYHHIGPQDLERYDTVINCAGAVKGSADDLDLANSALPAAIAAACQSAGVRRLIHVSSFSVLGPVENVSAETPVRPDTTYGRSKLCGDEAILATATDDMAVIPLRLPAIIDADGEGKVERLVRFWRTARTLPVPRTDVRRVMISSALAAEAIARLVGVERSGVRYAGDPLPFTFRDAEAAIREGSGRPVTMMSLPDAAFRPLKALAPAMYRSLYTDCTLAPEANVLADAASDLMVTIAKIAGAS